MAGLPAAQAAQIELIDQVPPARASDTASGGSSPAALSADHRYLVFLSDAPNLVPGQVDVNGAADVFLYDRITSKTTLVSRTAASALNTGNGGALSAGISADGRWIVFASLASDLIDGQRDGALSNVFLQDRITGATTLVSRSRGAPGLSGNGISDVPVMSADGRWIAFRSTATDLVDRQVDLNQGADVFLYDRQARRTVLVSHSTASVSQTGNDFSGHPGISADGRYIVFSTRATDLVPGVAGGGLIVYDRDTGKSLESPGPDAVAFDIGGNGDCVAYNSDTIDGVPGQQDGNSGQDVFLFDRRTRKTTLVSHAYGSPLQTGDEISGDDLRVSADCSWVAFDSYADNLLATETEPSFAQVFLFERATGQITLVSGVDGSPTTAGDDESFLAGLSADGRRVAFRGRPPGLTIPPKSSYALDVLLYDRKSRKTTLASQVEGAPLNESGNGDAGMVVLSDDGSWLAFSTFASNLESGVKDNNGSPDVYLWNRATGGHELVTRRDPARPSRTPENPSFAGDVSIDGRYVVYASFATNLLPRQRDTNGVLDIFLYDRALKTTRLVSRTAAFPNQTGNGWSADPRMSADGRYIVYDGIDTDLVPGQTSPEGDPPINVFLYDRVTATNTLISPPSDLLGPTGGGGSPVVSADGSTLAFVGQGGVYLYDRATGHLTLASHAFGSPTSPGDSGSGSPSISADGRFLAFSSAADDLLATRLEPGCYAYLYDRSNGTVSLVGRMADDQLSILAQPVLSGDGSQVAFASTDTHLVTGQSDDIDSLDLFLYDRIAGTTRLVTHAPGAPATAVGSTFDLPAFSADGRLLLFGSDGTLVTGQPSADSFPHVFVFDLATGSIEAVGGPPNLQARRAAHGKNTKVGSPGNSFGLSPDGRYVAYTFDQSLPDQPGVSEVFLYDRTSRETVPVSRSPGVPSKPGNGSAAGNLFVLNGGFVLFDSFASNLVDGDFSAFQDVFFYSPGNPP